MTVFKTLGLTGELGALVMGVLFSGHKTAEKLSNKIWSLREVLLLGFFISLGMKINFDPGIIESCLLLLGLLFIKAIVLFFLLLVFKLDLHCVSDCGFIKYIFRIYIDHCYDLARCGMDK